jgi:hypothetical protein
MRSSPVPSEERLQRLIFEAHENLPGPDRVRLQQLETHLQRQAARRATRRQPVRAPWWLILLLAGGAATAAWWAAQRLQPEPPGPAPDRPAVRRTPAAPPGSASSGERTPPARAGRPAAGNRPDSPIIDKREGP